MSKGKSLFDVDDYRVRPRASVRLSDYRADDDGGVDREEGEAAFQKLGEKLSELQELMYADGRHAMLIVFQAMDAGGKDSTIRSVLGPINPQGCKVINFKAPNDTERRHDFLWRVHQNCPRLGNMVVFNRSHYEDVLIARVKDLVPKARWKPRYEHINAFEKMLSDEGTVIVKFYLHITKDYQKERLQRRLAMPEKHWKFDPGDLVERAHWDKYQEAYEVAMRKCSTKHAPWYVVPAEKRWFRNLLIASVLVQTLQGLKMRYPKPTFDASKIVIE